LGGGDTGRGTHGHGFEDREDAGRQLAAALPQFRERPDTLVLGLARGGIPVAAATAEVLHLPFGALLVRKLGIPGHDETAYGALAYSGGRIVRLLNRPLVERILDDGVRREWLDQVEHRERTELMRRADSYPAVDPDMHGKTALLVDDGLATGATMRAAVEAVRMAGAAAVVAAAPSVRSRLRSHCPGSATSCVSTCQEDSGLWEPFTGTLSN
jgi:putative phosphoribosyl transferase